MNKFFLLVVTIAVCCLTSCKIKQSRKITISGNSNQPDSILVPKKDETTTLTTSSISLEKQKLINSLMPIESKTIEYSTFAGKAKMHYEDRKQKRDFVAHFRLKKDSVVWVNIVASVLSVQFARVYITPDTIKLVYYLQRKASIMPFSRISQLLPTPVKFAELQSLIVGNALHKEGDITDASSFGDTWSIQLEDARYVQQLSYNKSDSTLLTSQLRPLNDYFRSAMVQYKNYMPIDGRRFANNRIINISSGPHQYYLGMDFTAASFDQPTEFPFSIPGNYSVN
jgi:hypothetical protein